MDRLQRLARIYLGPNDDLPQGRGAPGKDRPSHGIGEFRERRVRGVRWVSLFIIKEESKMADRKETESAALLREIRDAVTRMAQNEEKNDRARRLSERQQEFEAWMRNGESDQDAQVGFRVTAIPSGAAPPVDEVFQNRDLSRGLRKITGQWGTNTQNQEFFPARDDLSEYPALGGAVWATIPAVEKAVRELILRNGLIDVWVRRPWHKDQRQQHAQPLLYFDWILGVIGNVLLRVDSFGRAAQAATRNIGFSCSCFLSKER